MKSVNEIIQKGNAYRICIDNSDETNLQWARQSFWTAASDVEFEDGMTAEEKIGAFKGMANTDGSDNDGYMVDTKYLKQQLSGCLKIVSFDEETATLTVTKIQ